MSRFLTTKVFGFFGLLLLLLMTSTTVFASSSCEVQADRATLGIYNFIGGGVEGASATVYKKQVQSDGSLNLIAFTDHHVIAGICPGIHQGQSCQALVSFSPTGCQSVTLTLPILLQADSNEGLHDISVISISGITPQNFQNSYDCVATLDNVIGTYTAGEPVLRYGYRIDSSGNFSKGEYTGTFAGFADDAEIHGNTPYPQAPSKFNPYRPISNMAIEPGNCGGPVVEADSCALLGLSQVGPVDGKSWDLAALSFSSLYNGDDLSAAEAYTLIQHEPWSVVGNR